MLTDVRKVGARRAAVVSSQEGRKPSVPKENSPTNAEAWRARLFFLRFFTCSSEIADELPTEKVILQKSMPEMIACNRLNAFTMLEMAQVFRMHFYMSDEVSITVDSIEKRFTVANDQKAGALTARDHSETTVRSGPFTPRCRSVRVPNQKCRQRRDAWAGKHEPQPQ